MSTGAELDAETLELIVILIQQLKRNGFNDQDIRHKLRIRFSDTEVQAALELHGQQHQKEESESVTIREPRSFYGWYSEPKHKDDCHWTRLREVLLHKDPPWTKDMIQSLDQTSSLVVSHLAPPTSKVPVTSQGLVLGYIQSGKTANFSATIAKAVDEGYRLVIVLAGMHNNLRKQTEVRLREELVAPVEGKACTTLTSDDDTGDFRRRQSITANRTLVRADGFTMAVVKKNTSVLRALKAWLKEASEEVLKQCPTLIIDDESDQASVNTNKDDQDPTAINRHIREIVGMFNVVSYVGYTATPFANVFVNAQVDGELYPNDFLIALEKPATYYGPEELFGRDAVNGKQPTDGMPVIRSVTESDALLLRNGDRTTDGQLELTNSLRSAVDSFILAAGLRLCRGHWKQHITMLLHVTHLVDPQDALTTELRTYVDELRLQVEDNSPNIRKRISNLYERDFEKTTASVVESQIVDFEVLWTNIRKFIQSLEVIMDNSTSTNRLSFDASERNGEPVWAIVVGGNTLSRGLTVEGLTTSFFVRGSKAYDTLLQMGRWFGYRKGYADLTRIFVTSELFDFFLHLATVEQEIRDEVKVMAINGERPIDVALRIRRHPNLLITATNKMRSATVASVTYSGAKAQTRQIYSGDEKIVSQNAKAIIEFMKKVKGSHGAPIKVGFRDLEQCILYRGISPESVLQLLDSYKVPSDNPNFRVEMIQSYITELVQIGELNDWSIALMSQKNGDALDIAGHKIYPLRRNAKHETMDDRGKTTVVLRALSTPGEELLDLEDQLDGKYSSTDNILEPQGKARTSDTQLRFQFRPRTRGLLMIYPLQSNITMPPEEHRRLRSETSSTYPLKAAGQVFGLSLVFPESASSWGRGGYVRNKHI